MLLVSSAITLKGLNKTYMGFEENKNYKHVQKVGPINKSLIQNRNRDPKKEDAVEQNFYHHQVLVPVTVGKFV